MRKVSLLSTVAVALLVCAPAAQADTIDFSQFAPSLATSTLLSGTTADGVGFHISGAPLEVRVQGSTWNGAFATGNHVVFNSSYAPTIIGFAADIASITDIGLQMNAFGPYTAIMNAYDVLGNLIGSVSYSGVSSSTPNTLMGFNLAVTGIRSLEFMSPIDGSGHGLGNAPSGAVPEPATWAMMIAGFCIAGSAMRRRMAQQPASFA